MQFGIWKKSGLNTVSKNVHIILIETSDEESENEYQIEDIHFVLVATQNPKKVFASEMKTSTIIDTACTETVAREE